MGAGGVQIMRRALAIRMDFVTICTLSEWGARLLELSAPKWEAGTLENPTHSPTQKETGVWWRTGGGMGQIPWAPGRRASKIVSSHAQCCPPLATLLRGLPSCGCFCWVFEAEEEEKGAF